MIIICTWLHTEAAKKHTVQKLLPTVLTVARLFSVSLHIVHILKCVGVIYLK